LLHCYQIIMLQHIIRYDWLLLRKSNALTVSVILLAAFMTFALWNGAQHTQFQRQTLAAVRDSSQKAYTALQSTVRAIEQGNPYTGNPFQNPQTPYTIGANKGARFATLPPGDLALVSFGQSDLLPYYYRVTMTKKQSLYHAEEIENAAILYNGNFDVAFVIVYLLPLLIIALSYNVVASEQEQGTLAMLLASNARFDSLVLTKYVFRFALLTGIFTVMLLAGLPLAGVNIGQAAAQSQSLSQCAFMLLVTVLYSAFWLAFSNRSNISVRAARSAAFYLVECVEYCLAPRRNGGMCSCGASADGAGAAYATQKRGSLWVRLQ
jgi:ABC-2 type transport system permease protein